MKRVFICFCLAMIFCACVSAQSTETVLYSFGGAPDGGGRPGERFSIRPAISMGSLCTEAATVRQTGAAALCLS